MVWDLVIKNGDIIDGTGEKRYKANIGIRNGIIEVITHEEIQGNITINAENFIVAPGFIDIHSHADWVIFKENHEEILAPFLLQGVTTFVGGNCGFSPHPITEDAKALVTQNSEFLMKPPLNFSWYSTEEYLEYLDQQGVFLNTAVLMGHNTLRALVMGNSSDKPSEDELVKLESFTRQSLKEGAFGLSMGLAYSPGIFADDKEIYRLLKVVSEEDGIWTFHGRTYSWTSPFYRPKYTGVPHNIRDLKRLLQIAQKARVKVNVSHVIVKGENTWKTYKLALQTIENAAQEGLDVAFDALPYHWGNSNINILFPEWFLDGFNENIKDPQMIQRLKKEVLRTEELIGRSFKEIYLLSGGTESLSKYEGSSFSEIAEELGLSEIDAYIRIAIESRGAGKILTASYSGKENGYEEPLFDILSHPLCSFELDSILTDPDEPQNPASYGGFPRILGRFCRDLKLFTLEEAIRRMTYFSANRIGLQKVGRIAQGYWADIVIFDKDTIADNTTLKIPNATPGGIEAVVISGKLVVKNGVLITHERHGRVMRKT